MLKPTVQPLFSILILPIFWHLWDEIKKGKGQRSEIDTPQLTQGTNGKVTTSQLDITNES